MIHTKSPASSASFSSIKTGLKQALRQRTGIHFRNESKFTSPVPEVQITFLFFFSHSLFFIFLFFTSVSLFLTLQLRMESICRFLVENQQKETRLGLRSNEFVKVQRSVQTYVSDASTEIILAYLFDLTPHVRGRKITNKRRLRITAAPNRKNSGFILGLQGKIGTTLSSTSFKQLRFYRSKKSETIKLSYFCFTDLRNGILKYRKIFRK